MELVALASGLVGTAVTVVAFVRAEMARRRAQRIRQQILAAAAVGVVAISLAWVLRGNS